MIKTLAIAIMMVCTVASVFAQKQTNPLPDNERMDSLFQYLPKLNRPFALPFPKEFFFPENRLGGKGSSFETANPGATVINHTERGTIYNMPQDNMPVLVPGQQMTEHMPGSSPNYKPGPRSNMPNPLYPRNGLPKKP